MATATADNLTLMPPGDPDDFVVIEDRPVFKAHWTREVKGDDGKVEQPKKYIGEEALRRIVARCNSRIADTGDFVPLVLRHTTDDGGRDPEVIGYAGPFRMSKMGRLKPLPAIAAKLWVYKSDADKLRKYPRLSVEYWADESDPTNGYFDPISLLGAETPELDLGIQYSKGKKGSRLMRYSRVVRFQAAFPGGNNTFVPSGTNEKKTHYEKGGTMELAPEQMQQFVAALRPMIEEIVAEKMDSKGPSEDELMADVEDEGNDEPTDVETDSDMALDADATDVAPPPKDDATATPYAKMCGFDSQGDEAGAKKYMAELGPDERSGVVSAVEADADTDRKMRMQKYMADPAAPDDEATMPMPAKYAKAHRERTEYRTRYEKEVAARKSIEQERDTLKSQIESVNREKRKADCYQKFAELQGQGFMFDAETEMGEIADSGFTNDAVEARVKLIQRYARVPLGGRYLPVPKAEKVDYTDDREKRAVLSDKARAKASQYRKEGKHITYDEAMKLVLKEETAAA